MARRLTDSPRAVPGHAAGFTLLEILVVLIVFGMLMTGLTKGIQLGIRAVERQSVALDERGELDAIDRTLRDLLTHIDPGGGRTPIHLEGKSDQFRFQSRLPTAVALLTRRADMTLLLNDNHQLVLRWKPLFHETSFSDPPEPTDTVLLDNVEKLEFAYWAPDVGSGPAGWQDDWQAPYLPPVIRLRLSCGKGDKRHGPEILVSPLLEQPGG
jgi:general secretion pathway protein J